MAKTFRRIGPRVGKNSRSTLRPLPLYDLILVTTTDTTSIVQVSGYFDEYADIVDMNDTIMAQASDGTLTFVVTAVSSVVHGDAQNSVSVLALSDKALDDRVSALETGSPIIFLSIFTSTVDVDTLVADLLWAYTGTSPPVGWIVKEDDTSLPLVGDADWVAAEPQTFTLSTYNQHTLTGRVKDANGNISNAITITVVPSESTPTIPVITVFTTINPAAGSQDYLFSLAATGTITHYILVDNDATQPLEADAGWITWAGDYTDEAASLDDLVDTTVRAYVKNDATTPDDISNSVSSFVDVEVGGGETAPNGDFLWINNPTTGTYDSGLRTFSGSGALTIDGTDTGTYTGGSLTTTGDDNPAISITGTYSAITIINMLFPESNGTHIKIDGIDNCAITIRNNKFQTSNSNNSATNLFKGAISINNCNSGTLDILGNWFDGPDGCIIFEECDSPTTNATCRIRHNFISKMVRHNSTSPSLFVTNFVTGRFGRVYGDISENIYYEPTGDYYCQDILNIATFYGELTDAFDVTRNRFWVPSTDQGTNAAVQLGDKSSNQYVDVYENTFIDINSFGQFSSGHHHLFRNNKGYTSELFPAVSAGYIFHIQRQGVDAGNMYSCTFEGNTFLHFYDDGSGTLQQRGVYYPAYGRDPDWTATYPNHGVCVDACGVEDNVAPTGFLTTNDFFHGAWGNGVGKSELWRASWNSFSYAGSDGLTPTITYDSPWIGDGGTQGITAANATLTTFGDGAEIDSIQQHDVLSLVTGGVQPYTVSNVASQTNCTVTINTGGEAVTFTAGTSAGAFTYSYTVTDANSESATGTISGTLVDSSTEERNYWDQDGEVYISISLNPTNLPATPVGTELPNYEYYSRNGNTWASQSGSNSPNGTYMQHNPYGITTVAVGDVESLSAEMVFHVYFDANGTYTAWINGMALFSTSYDTCWGGFDDTPNAEEYDVIIATTPTVDASDWNYDDGDRGAGPVQITISAAPKMHSFHIWTREGGLAIGKIVITSGAQPTNPGPDESPVNKY